MIFNIPTNILNKKFSSTKTAESEPKKKIFWIRLYYMNFKHENFKETPTEKMINFFNLANNASFFEIESKNNKYLNRMFESIVNRLKAQQEWDLLEKLIDDKDKWLIETANTFTQILWNEYKNVVNECFNRQEYPAEFVCLMLNEMLAKTYIQRLENNKTVTLVRKREPHKTFESHMILNTFIMKYIYENGEKLKSFKELYFKALKKFSQKQRSIQKIANIETLGLGRWLIFKSVKDNPKESEEVAQTLCAIIQDTNWCTASYVTSELKSSIFYIFMGNDNKPHIAAKITGNCLEEIRGIYNGEAQEIQEEYLTVAEQFLKPFKNIKQGENWLEDVSWNIRLIHYIKVIKGKKEIDIKKFLEDYSKSAYRAHSGIENSRKKELHSLMPAIMQQASGYFNTDGDILIDVVIQSLEELNRCRIILGNLILSKLAEEKCDLSHLVFCKDVLCTGNLQMKEIILPSTIKRIHQEAFMDCVNLNKITIPNTVTAIEQKAFWSCKSLTTIELPYDILNIEREAFHGCKKLRKIIIPNTVKNMGRRVFFNCINLRTIILPANLINLNKEMFLNCKNLKEIIIPDGVRIIEERVFANCSNLEKIVLPANLAKIEEGAFAGCEMLKPVLSKLSPNL